MNTRDSRFAAMLENELRRHPSERRVKGSFGRFALWSAASDLISKYPEGCLTSLFEAMMGDYDGNPEHLTEKQKRERKKWDAMSRQAGHEIGSCFDTSDGLCAVCRK